MRTPSRNMPPLPRSSMTAVVAYLMAVLGIGGTLAWWLDVVAVTLFVIAGVVVLIIGARVSRRTKLRELSEGRTSDPLCNFARAFDARQVDTWIIRAVWDSLQFYVARRGNPLPLLLEDRVVDDLCIDPEDLEDIAMDVAKRTGRSADDFETNPLFGKVELFVNHQPRLPGLRVG